MLAPVAVVFTLATPAPSPQALWDAWPRARFVETPAACLKHAEMVQRLGALAAKHPGRARVEEVGRSAEGRPIFLLALGSGARHVLLWSQMHGDEPSATPALLDVADHLLTEASGRAVLDELTLLMVPMLNPDGTERGARRNAQGIDVNRDALNLATPEGRILKSVRDRYQPILGFNLHDQDRRTTVGDSGRLAAIALLAVAGDAQGTMTAGRMRAKRVASAVVGAVEPFLGASVARYDEDWSPRAFGDNITAWGTPVVLIESGGLASGRPLSDLTRLNFVALVSVLSSLAADDAAAADPVVYERLSRNRSDAFADVVVRGGRILQGAVAPYRADIAFDVEVSRWGGTSATSQGASLPPTPPSGRRPAAPSAALPVGLSPCPADSEGPSRIVEVGDARFLTGGREVDAAGKLIVPAFVASVRGTGARWWLTPAALDELARLGVGTLRWHVPLRDVGRARLLASERSAAGRPAIDVVASTAPLSALVVERAPRRPAVRSLAGVLDALGAWRAPKRAVAASLPLLTMPPAAGPPPIPLTREAPASFLVLDGGDGDLLDPAALLVESVFIDGREMAAFAPRGTPAR